MMSQVTPAEEPDAQSAQALEDDVLLAETTASFGQIGLAVDEQFPALVEALLLAAPDLVTVDQLALAAEVDPAAIEAALQDLDGQQSRGWVIQRHGKRVQLATNPRFAGPVRRLLGMERETRLSAAALETLAIVAYQQPVTRSVIESVRGVDSAAVLSTLLTRGLIESRQRHDLPGQPFEYETTPAFLQHFGIRSLDDLPPLAGPEGSNLAERLTESVAEARRHDPALELVGSTVRRASPDSEITNP
jgi:segregation and condensation protein B